MTNRPKVLYEFGPFQVDPDKQVLRRGKRACRHYSQGV